MKIKLLKPYGFSNPGDLLDINLGVAEQLIQRGVAELVKESKRGGKDDTNKTFFAPPKPHE